jgi:hypothetical protein
MFARLLVLTLIALGFGTANASAFPKELYGNSVVVSWADTVQYNLVGQNVSRSGLVSYSLSIYISTAGRPFSRLMRASGFKEDTFPVMEERDAGLETRRNCLQTIPPQVLRCISMDANSFQTSNLKVALGVLQLISTAVTEAASPRFWSGDKVGQKAPLRKLRLGTCERICTSSHPRQAAPFERGMYSAAIESWGGPRWHSPPRVLRCCALPSITVNGHAQGGRTAVILA